MSYEVDKWDMEDREIDDKPLNKKNKRDVEMAREYCDEHEAYYGSDTCEPTWKKNGDLDIYIITLHKNKKAKLKFIKERNKK
jgi:hypothetical protein